MVFPAQKRPAADVFMDGENIGLSPNTFSVTSNGVQFVSNTPVSPYKVVELTFSLPSSEIPVATTLPEIAPDPGDSQKDHPAPNHTSKNCCRTVCCSGMVVDCCKDADCGSYTISLFFLNLPKTVQEKICTQLV